MNVNQVLNEIESIIKPMKRTDAMLTPEEARLYERYSVEQAQAMACIRPVASTDSGGPGLTLQDKIDLLKLNGYVVDTDEEKVMVYDSSIEQDYYNYCMIENAPVTPIIEDLVNNALKDLDLV